MPNLIPQKEKRIIYNNYRAKIVSFWLVGMMISVLLGAILLLPSYFLTISKLKESNENVEVLKKSVNYQESRHTEEEISNTNKYIKILLQRASGNSIDKYLAKIISLTPSGVHIDSIGYHLVDLKNAEIFLAGESGSREKMIAYVDALKDSNMFIKVDLPIGNLAKEKEITFNLTLSLDLNQ